MELILIRHGRPDRAEDDIDPPLGDAGQDQAARLAGVLAGERIDSIWSSPMRRALQTAQSFGDRSSLEIQSHRGIGELGPGEDIKSFRDKVVGAIEEIITANAGHNVAVFCHGGVINIWTAHVLGLTPGIFFEPGHASISRYLCARSGHRSIVSLNERFHLR